MRKLKLQMQISADGFVAGPNGELDWMVPEVDLLQLERLQSLTESMDTILMGRKMAHGFTSYWENVVDKQPDSPEYPYAKIFVDTPKIVFSRTVDSMDGRNVQVENGDLQNRVNQLKMEEGKDLIVYGGANFVSELIKFRLIDQLHLFTHPVALGKGLQIFQEQTRLELVDSLTCKSGIVINQYTLKG